MGKSALFNHLTGAYATVSNYPGTTVEVTRGEGVVEGETVEVIDTPGFYSFLPVTEEERVTRRLLVEERPDLILHVVEAAALDRMLPLTFQLLEAGFPVGSLGAQHDGRVRASGPFWWMWTPCQPVWGSRWSPPWPPPARASTN